MLGGLRRSRPLQAAALTALLAILVIGIPAIAAPDHGATTAAKKAKRGKRGPRGKTGKTGPAGPRGLTGAPGAAGKDGAPGAPGKDGAIGPQGPGAKALLFETATPTLVTSGATGPRTQLAVIGPLTFSATCDRALMTGINVATVTLYVTSTTAYDVHGQPTTSTNDDPPDFAAERNADNVTGEQVVASAGAQGNAEGRTHLGDGLIHVGSSLYDVSVYAYARSSANAADRRCELQGTVTPAS